MTKLARAIRSVLLALLTAAAAYAQTSGGLPPELVEEIDRSVTRVLQETGVPSASVAVVHGGAPAWTKAYGLARLDPPTPAADGKLEQYTLSVE